MEPLEDDQEDYTFPPSPSPAPRFRPKGPRGNTRSQRLSPTIVATTSAYGSNSQGSGQASPDISTNRDSLHQRDASNSSVSSYKGVATTAKAALSIRPVTDTSLRVVNAAKSPYPVKPSQFLYPTNAATTSSSGTFRFIEGFPAISSAAGRQSQRIINVGESSGSSRNSSNNTHSSSSSGKASSGNKSDKSSGIATRTNQLMQQQRQPTVKEYQPLLTSTSATTNNKQKNNPPSSLPSTLEPTPKHNSTTSDTPKVRNTDTLFNNASRPILYDSPSFPLHNEPRLVPLSAQRSRSFPPSSSSPISESEATPPGEVARLQKLQHNQDYPSFDDYDDFKTYLKFSSSSSSKSSGGIDVDRLAMVEGEYNVNNDHLGVPPFLTPREQQRRQQQQQQQHGSNPSTPFLVPGSPSNAYRVSSGLGAIASVASDLQIDSTPMSVGESIDSSGTVIRKKGYTGPIPPGYYSLFPPVSTPQSASSRNAAESNQPSRTRSTSAPARPVSEGPLSPMSAGSNSPVSPVSPDDNDSLYSSSRPRTRSRSDSMWNIGILQTPTVLVPDIESNRSSQYSIGNQIPRKPVARSNAIKYNSFMSTIHSESEGDNRSSVGQSLRDHLSDSNTIVGPTSATSPTAKVKEQYRRSSSALPRSSAIEDHPMPSASATIDFSQMDTDFPMGDEIDDLVLPERRPTIPTKRRLDSEASIAGTMNQPSRKQSNNVTSPTSIYSRAEYRDSHSQTEAAVQTDRIGNAQRDSLPAWARLYYANERRHRETLGRARDSTPSARRHTVGTTDENRDSLNQARYREATSARSRHPHVRQSSNPEDRSIFYGEDLRDAPHLRYGRAAALRRRTMFMAPSIDEGLEGVGLTRRNIQVWCFVIGFIFPLAWWAAAVLPLPPCPRTPPASPGFEHDLEKTLGPFDLARYENARWWRNINRIMSVVGVGVIVAIIVLAVVASKMANGQYT